MASVRDRYCDICVENVRICDESSCGSAGELSWDHGVDAPLLVLAPDLLNRFVAFHIAARPFRSLLFDGDVAAPQWGSGLDQPPQGRDGCAPNAVSRPRSLVRDVRSRRAPRASPLV
ncbi:hypothetical protein ACJJTC_017425 [Scirpophaga incertulas]